MKYRQANIVSAFLITAIAAGAQVVEIQDPELEEVIRHHLVKPDGDITVADIEESLVELDASVLGRWGPFNDPPLIQSLEGLQAATNLETLNLAGRVGSCATPNISLESPAALEEVLQHLEKLTALNLKGNDLGTLNLPSGLSNIMFLDLSEIELVDLTIPEGLASLTWLDLSGNQLADLTLPDGLSNLTTLDLGENRLTSLNLPGGFCRVPVGNRSHLAKRIVEK